VKLGKRGADLRMNVDAALGQHVADELHLSFALDAEVVVNRVDDLLPRPIAVGDRDVNLARAAVAGHHNRRAGGHRVVGVHRKGIDHHALAAHDRRGAEQLRRRHHLLARRDGLHHFNRLATAGKGEAATR
jgi:hypothetical protein